MRRIRAIFTVGVVGMVAAASAQQIIPGVSAGKVKLGMTEAQVRAVMGKPTAEGNIDSGTEEMVWVGKLRTEPGFRRREFFSVYLRKGKVVQIETSWPTYKTPENQTTDSTWRQLVAEFPGGKLKSRSYPWEDETLVLYAGDHVEKGITWVRGAIGKDMPAQPDRTRKIDFIAIHPKNSEFIFGLTHPDVWKKQGPLVRPSASEKIAKVAGNAASTSANDFRLGPKIGDLTPGLVSKTLDGRSFDLNAVTRKSRAVILNFWSSSVDASRRELPALEEMYQYWKRDGLMVIGINTQDTSVALKKYVSEKKIRFPMISDRTADGAVKSFGIIEMPTSVVIGKDGKVIDIIQGFNEDRLKRALDKAGFRD